MYEIVWPLTLTPEGECEARYDFIAAGVVALAKPVQKSE